MKKWLFLIFAIIIAGSVLGYSVFYVDNDAPIIMVKQKPIIACDVTSESLLKYAEASDEHLKSFFVEDPDLAIIAEAGRLTYVAIDENNNISKVEVPVDLDRSINTYHIEVTNDLSLPARSNLLASKYFALKNECGWNVRDSFTVDGVDRKTPGSYSAIINSRKYKSNNLLVAFNVSDSEAPTIKLKEIAIEVDANTELDYSFFEYLVEELKDNKTSEDILYNDLTIDYKDELKTRRNGTTEPGEYLITYTAIDSDDNIAKATLRVKVVNARAEEESSYE